MRLDDLKALDLARYRLHLRSCEATSFPPFLGSTLRGAFGHSLKRSVCIMRPTNCAECLVSDQCIYPYLFETPVPEGLPRMKGNQQAPRPFVLSPPIFYPTDKASSERATSISPQESGVPAHAAGRRHHLAAGDVMTFNLILMGRAISYLPYIVYTISEMAHNGLGVNRARFELNRVELVTGEDQADEIYNSESQRIIHDSPRENLAELVQTRLAGLTADDHLRLRFLTPTRIRVEGGPQGHPDFDLLARNLLRRVLFLGAVHGQGQIEFDARVFLAAASQVTICSSELHWWDLDRYSNRQKTKIKIGGFLGEMAFAGEQLSQFMPLVAAGELLHIGSGTSFGLGRYQIVA